ncbi:MXAN_5187 family protein [Anaeromyxobacter sp. Red801]|uniref:MXAN_5187 family protein n=1 Tax=Anaeromyxobacter sp. Red801 TaxID=3411632 RepID=UPI003BA3BCB9
MNRLKLWLYALIVVGAGAAALHLLTSDLRASALRQLDGRLQAGAARLAASQHALQAEANGVAALAARDAALLQALAPAAAVPAGKARGVPAAAPEPAARAAALDAAAAAALAAAQSELGTALAGARAVAVDAAELDRRAAEPAADADVVAALREALAGKPRRAYTRAQGGLAFAVAVPAGGAGAVAVVVPLDAAWLRGVAAGTGVDLTLAVPGAKVASSAPAGADELAAAARGGAGRERDAGRLAPVKVDVLGVGLGAQGFLVGAAPAHRVLAVPVAGLQDAAVVVSAQAAPALAPLVRLQWNGVALLAVLLVLGLLFGALVRSAEPAPDVPADLLAAADRIGRGDFAARAPAMAGKMGTLSAALNRATEAAGAAAHGPAPSLTQEFFAAPAPAPEPESFQLPPRPPPAPVAAPSAGATQRLDASALQGGAFEAAPVPAPPPARPAPAFAPEPPQAVAGDLLQAAARTAAPEPASDEEHWREVFRDFLRVRGECGEPVEGLTFERFRQKLEQNRATLVAKYGCRTVRFQVYVKEGKTALKATPVR